MSGADYFTDDQAINAYMGHGVPVQTAQAMQDHENIKQALEEAGVRVIQVPPPKDCQDGVYTANWGLCNGDRMVLSALPNTRQAETPYARATLQEMGREVIELPGDLRFSGQGDALPCGKLLFIGTGYRTDEAAHQLIGEALGLTPVPIQAIPALNAQNQPVMNVVTGWADSFFYDLDLAIAVLRPDLIAWCPDALVPESQARIRSLPLEKIEVSYAEATEGLACNLVSTGETVVMSSQAPNLQAAIEKRGIKTITPEVRELQKGGGFIRCTTLTLD